MPTAERIDKAIFLLSFQKLFDKKKYRIVDLGHLNVYCNVCRKNSFIFQITGRRVDEGTEDGMNNGIINVYVVFRLQDHISGKTS
jgi:hypothetical protein